MPRISAFYGIVIRMYYDDHNPPHFHACYQRHRAAIAIRCSTCCRATCPCVRYGSYESGPPRDERELLIDWELAGTAQPLRAIAALR